MIVPSSANIKVKFPEFADVPDAAVEFAIEEAARNVDDTWLPLDQALALMYYAGHVLMITLSRAESASGQQVTSERIGEINLTYKTPTQPTEADASDLTTTPYGIKFRDLARRNFPAVVVV